MSIDYRVGNQLDLDQVIELYRSSTLGERRPVDDRERMGAMLRMRISSSRPGTAICW